MHSELTWKRQKIDEAFIRTSTRFNSLETKTQEIIEAITSAKGGLSHDLFEFIAKVICRSEAVNQEEHHQTRQMIADLRYSQESSSSAVGEITAQIEMLSVDPADEELLRRTTQKEILQQLQYPYMTNRYDQLVEAHPNTFDWIFCNSDEWQFPWNDFSKWLKEGQGIYWINGKPASGKSTLMKHIYDDEKTKEYLQQWVRKIEAEPVPFCLVTFFFWSTGTTMQRSQEGLLRSLLFQVLVQYPDLIPLIFPSRWAQYYSSKLSLRQEIRPEPWSSRQLHEAFERLVCQIQYPLKICFCIDGLDEFSGDAEQLCLFMKRLSIISDTTKICLSSRPCVEFKQNFQGCASLRLQDLTANDISTYVNDKLNGSVAFTQLAARDKELASKLANEIVDRAEGVFLWVEIVVCLLLKGINNWDTIPQLWKRLRSFPTELEALYESMVSRIEPIYSDWVSKAFQYMVAAAELFYDPFRRSTFADAPEDTAGLDDGPNGAMPLTLIEFSFALQGDYNLGRTKVMSASQIMAQLEETVMHLAARCVGFLEISDTEKLNGLAASFRIVRWMHRTTHDFVRDSTRWSEITNEDCFKDPSVSCQLMTASLLSLKMLAGKSGKARTSEPWPEHWAGDLVQNALIFAHYADGHLSTRTIRSKLLAVLENPNPSLRGLGTKEKLLRTATIHCLSEFVEDVLSKQDPPARQKSAKEMLCLLYTPEHFSSFQYPYPTRKIIECLIKMENFAPSRTSHTLEELSAVVRGFELEDERRYRQLTSFEASFFIASYLSTIDAFLKADVDPTDSFNYLPSNFVLPVKAMQRTIEKSVEGWREVSDTPDSAVNIIVVLNEIRVTLISEVQHQTRSKASAKKRKVDLFKGRTSSCGQKTTQVLAMWYLRKRRGQGKRSDSRRKFEIKIYKFY